MNIIKRILTQKPSAFLRPARPECSSCNLMYRRLPSSVFTFYDSRFLALIIICGLLAPPCEKNKNKKYTTPKKKVSSLPSVPERVQSRLNVYCERCAPLNVCNELNFYIFWKIYYPIAVGKGFGGTGDPMHEGRGKVIEIIKTVYLFIKTVQVARAFALLFRTLNRRKRRNLW